MFLKINDHMLHVTTAGKQSDPTVVLLHSLGTSWAVWEKQVAALATDRYVICPEFRGHGLSDESRDPVTCETLADDILSVLAEMGIGEFALVGISLGGVVAQIVAGKAGARATGLALFDSYIASLNPQMWRDRAAKIRADGLVSIAPGVLKIWMTDADRDSVDGVGMARILATASSEGYAACCDALAIADNHAIAGLIVCPTVVAVGSEDHAAPVVASEALAAGIAGARLELIEGAAHIPTLHHPDRCTSIIRSIL